MSKTTNETNSNGTTNGTTETTAKTFATREEALTHKPENPKAVLFTVTAPNREPMFCWALNHALAVSVAARADGYKASSAGKAPTKEKVSEMLGQLSAEDRAILIAQYVPAAKGKRS